MPIGNCNPSTFTISGISSGACMAIQFQYAWSSLVRGAAIVAGAPYLCAGGTIAGAEACLNTPYVEEPDVFFAAAEESAAMGLIDPLEGLANHTIFLFSGTADTVVPQPNMNNVVEMYAMAGASSRVHTFFNYSAEHAWVTSKYGNNCSFLGRPYVNNCDIDFGGRFLEAALKDFGMSWNATFGTMQESNLFSFDQTRFGASPQENSMATEGFVYIPKFCQDAATSSQCHLHVNMHGCRQDFLSIGTQYILQTQLNEWAETNHFIVVYPQATANDELVNPLGCFDWWGYASETYALKSGPQISIIRSMIQFFG
eukprot:CAMPEP_0176446764 /NCGR_PEP_ID=MMETSP0127-20121128/24533_1 /TAXON_ID=938130 /ORGANISM="Platyophrya macrostoma, Strain WH" /LENGTH=312 /DNA_ID=CAMNT_0017832887 /DNA_START=200 /DNA_END=1134 /DNA_ORIENTATION=+